MDDLENSIRMLTYIKRMRPTIRTQARSRIVNIILAFMNCFGSLVTILALIYSFTREPLLS